MAKSPARGADFVAKIVKDPKNPPKTIMLTGFLGASSEPGHTRLYFDPHLSNYVEVPDDAILHTQEAPGEGGLEATHVWIRQDAQLIYGPAGAERPKGTFLEGPIMQAHMPAAAAAAAGGAGIVAPAPNTANPACVAQPSVAIICQSAAVVCQSLLVQCQTPRIAAPAAARLGRAASDPELPLCASWAPGGRLREMQSALSRALRRSEECRRVDLHQAVRRAEPADDARYPVRGIVAEIGEVDLVHRLPIAAVGDIDGALDDVGHAAAGLLQQRADVIERSLRLRAHIADRKPPLTVASDAADEHEAAGDRRLRER
jgi:hypothetical protein